jgi:hypothetical protein
MKSMKVDLTPEQLQLQAKKLCKVVLHTWLDASLSLMNAIALHIPAPNIAQA